MGVVYRARDVDLKRVVAVKLLAERYAPDSATARRFLDEARITGQLQHPGIPAVHQAGMLPDGRPYLAMKLIRGQTLEELLKDAWATEPSSKRDETETALRGLPAADRGRFLAIFEQICQAVGYAHSHHVIHRDLKPANVMVGNFLEVQVMDWGLAKVLGEPGESLSVRKVTDDSELTEIHTTRELDGSYTEAGSLLGTPAFMPPEQAAGAVGRVDERADVFGLGAILCTILTGTPPYRGDDGETVRLKAMQGKVAEAFTRLERCGADPELISLCQRCLSTEPEARPRDAGEVARAVADLRAAAEDRAKRAELDRAAAEVRTAEERKRRRAQLALAAVVLVAAAGSAVGAIWYEHERAAAEADRAARRARTTSGVAAALEDARSRTEEGWALTADPPRMRIAAARADDAIRRAEGLLETGDPDEEMRHQVGTARQGVDDLGRHARFLVEAEQILREHAQVFASGSRMRAQRGRSAERLAAAFRAFGLDPIEMPAEQAGRAISESRVRDRLVGYLREWEFWVPGERNTTQVRAVTRAAQLAAGGPLARWQSARDRYDRTALQAVAASPDVLTLSPALINALGRDLGSAGVRGQPLIDLLRRSVEHYPDFAWGHYDLANACAGATPPLRAEALRHASTAAALVPDSAFFQHRLALAYEAINAPDQAVGCYRKAQELDPKHLNSHFGLAKLLEKRNDLDSAEDALRAAVAAEPELDQTHFELGRFLASRGKTIEAIVELRRAVDFLDASAGYNPAFQDLTSSLVKLGALADALRLQTRLMDLQPAWATNPEYPVRYNAACLAVALASRAETPPDEQAQLRRKAREWLVADLVIYQQRLGINPVLYGRSIHARMTQALRNTDLKAVRDQQALNGMPPPEREQWMKLWAEVHRLRDATTSRPPAPAPRPVGKS